MELILLSGAVIAALLSMFGGVYVLMRPDVNWAHLMSKTVMDSIRPPTYKTVKSPPVYEAHPHIDLHEPEDIEETITFTAAEDEPASDESDQQEEVPVYDPFNVQRNIPPVCDSFFSSCTEVTEMTSSAPWKTFVEQRTPAVLRAANSPTRFWDAMYWNIWQWASTRFPTLHNVAEEAVTDESPVSSFLRHGNTLRDEMLLWDFLTQIRNGSSDCRWYVGNYLDIEKDAQLQNDLDWKAWLIQDPQVPANFSTDTVAPELNLLHPGCALQAFYSEYHSVRIQLRGSLRVTLIPPTDSSKMALYPYTHPLSRHSQIRFYPSYAQPDRPADEAARSLAVKTVHLHAGDVLFIPPGWIMHSEAVQTAFFLDVRSPSVEQVKLLEATSTRLPFPADLTREEKIIHSQVYLVHVLSRVHGLTSIRKYAQKLLRSRYDLLFPQNSLLMQESTFSCFADQPEFHAGVVDKMRKIHLQNFADFVAARFNDEHVPAGVRWLWLGNFVDSVLRWTYDGTGSLFDAALFLRECLSLDGKIDVIEEVEGPPVLTLDPK